MCYVPFILLLYMFFVFVLEFFLTFTQEAKQAFESLLLLSLYQQRNGYYDTFSAAVKKRARRVYNYTFGAFEEVENPQHSVTKS